MIVAENYSRSACKYLMHHETWGILHMRKRSILRSFKLAWEPSCKTFANLWAGVAMVMLVTGVARGQYIR